MRKALNENPVVQIAVLGVLLVVVAMFMATRVLKDEETPAEQPVAGASLDASPSLNGEEIAAGTTAVPADPAAAPAAGGVPGTAPPPAATTPEAMEPGPGLPADVVAAWRGGKAVALLVVKMSGIDDRLVTAAAGTLSGDSRVALFVVRAKNVARYSRITQGVGLNRVPALIVVRPRAASGGVPEAQVSYGFRSSASVVQAVRDALYAGREDVPYHPG